MLADAQVNQNHVVLKNKWWHAKLSIRSGKIQYDPQIKHNTKLIDYGLKFNEFVSYSGWHDWPV